MQAVYQPCSSRRQLIDCRIAEIAGRSPRKPGHRECQYKPCPAAAENHQQIRQRVKGVKQQNTLFSPDQHRQHSRRKTGRQIAHRVQTDQQAAEGIVEPSGIPDKRQQRTDRERQHSVHNKCPVTEAELPPLSFIFQKLHRDSPFIPILRIHTGMCRPHGMITLRALGPSLRPCFQMFPPPFREAHGSSDAAGTAPHICHTGYSLPLFRSGRYASDNFSGSAR